MGSSAWRMYTDGPSPRVRGSPSASPAAGHCPRSIPACAGKPSRSIRRPSPPRVHPRVCGEAGGTATRSQRPLGPSPRVRGSRRVVVEILAGEGSIPACAGKPPSAGNTLAGRRVHPRVCGEALLNRTNHQFSGGPSPRVRGSRASTCPARGRGRSIPACAGKPPPSVATRTCPWVHPRVCGEASRRPRTLEYGSGPSPRVRGSPGSLRAAPGRARSIPACAGKPCAWSALSSEPPVHPRVCGEARECIADLPAQEGPSPRVRGSRTGEQDRGRIRRSIPACAGKPREIAACGAPTWVHPRVCGEANVSSPTDEEVTGPSPRVRGSPAAGRVRVPARGSIPACAGKPADHVRIRLRPAVHPRVCGEAQLRKTAALAVDGPSPRVRGSRCDADVDAMGAGSIPACAGKPRRNHPAASRDTVHPRVCGEADSTFTTSRRFRGPSPRVRGSPRLTAPART